MNYEAPQIIIMQQLTLCRLILSAAASDDGYINENLNL